MKRFLLMAALTTCLVVAETSTTHAQIGKPQPVSKAKLVKADTAVVTFTIQSGTQSIEASALRDSGTVSGKFYFEGKGPSGTWYSIDSLTLSNQLLNSKVFPLTSFIYVAYRGRFINGSAGNVIPAAYTVRWTGQ